MTTRDRSIRAVTFDLWETLLLEWNGASDKRSLARQRHVTKILNKLGLKTTQRQVTKAESKTVDWLLRIWNRNRDVSHIDQLRTLISFVSNGNVNLKDEWIAEISAAYISGLFEVPPRLSWHAHEILQWLKDRNMHTGLICNTGLTPGFALRRLLMQYNVNEYFDHMVFSDEIGIRKPDPAVFRLAAKKLKTKPAHIVHIGDNLKLDVWGAKNAGYKAIHLRSQEGHEKKAENNPKSLLALSRNTGMTHNTPNAKPDKTISSLAQAIKAIQQLQKMS
jgi:putative hydrolase of the HAD superfamily